MPLIIIDIESAPNALIGTLGRRMLEVRAGVFVGNLSRKAIEDAWALVEAHKPKAALLVYSAKNELGISLRAFGEHRYTVIDHYGIPLIQTTSSRR
jgi:CRISPR-associated protein Cas2